MDVRTFLRPKASLSVSNQAYERIFFGIDIGGTFADLVIHDHDSGRRWSCKVLTTHADPQQGVVAGVCTILAESGLDLRGISRVVHATTLLTNALIERKGAATGPAGHRRLSAICSRSAASANTTSMISASKTRRRWWPRNLRLDVSEWMRADGCVAEPFRRGGLLRQVDGAAPPGVTSVALVFCTPTPISVHEEQGARAIAAHAPELFVTPSHQVVREIRDENGASTTVAAPMSN